MQNYNDSVQNFKLIQAADAHGFSKRNMGIWDMILNRLGLPEHLHEPVRAIYKAGNWDRTEWDTIPIIRMAENITSNQVDLERIYNRLKKSIPRLFDWQGEQTFTIIDREIINERAQKYKTKARYRFLLYDLVDQLFNLPTNMPLEDVRKTVDESLKDYPMVDKPPRKPRKKRAKTLIKSISHNINELIEIEGSKESAAYDASEDDVIADFARSVTLIKNLQGE